jgi:hypothetical protein
MIGLKVNLLEDVMLGGEVLGGALAGSWSDRRPWQPSPWFLDLIFEVPPRTSTPTTALLFVCVTKDSPPNRNGEKHGCSTELLHPINGA